MIVRRYVFDESIALASYSDLLRQISRFASLGGVVLDGDGSRYSALALAVIDDLASEMVAVERNQHAWPGTLKILSADATRYMFRLSSGSLEILAGNARTLFDWQNPRLPEDLHFMRLDHSPVLGTIAHEDYAWLELSDEEAARWQATGWFPIHLESD